MLHFKLNALLFVPFTCVYWLLCITIKLWFWLTNHMITTNSFINYFLLEHHVLLNEFETITKVINPVGTPDYTTILRRKTPVEVLETHDWNGDINMSVIWTWKSVLHHYSNPNITKYIYNHLLSTKEKCTTMTSKKIKQTNITWTQRPQAALIYSEDQDLVAMETII